VDLSRLEWMNWRLDESGEMFWHGEQTFLGRHLHPRIACLLDLEQGAGRGTRAGEQLMGNGCY
jgi:hypothetical protein